MTTSNDHSHASAREGFLGWAIVIGLCALLILWGLLHYWLVRDAPRAWDFGVLPATPAESAYSAVKPPMAPAAPRQIPALPEADAGRPSGAGEDRK